MITFSLLQTRYSCFGHGEHFRGLSYCFIAVDIWLSSVTYRSHTRLSQRSIRRYVILVLRFILLTYDIQTLVLSYAGINSRGRLPCSLTTGAMSFNSTIKSSHRYQASWLPVSVFVCSWISSPDILSVLLILRTYALYERCKRTWWYLVVVVVLCFTGGTVGVRAYLRCGYALIHTLTSRC